MILAIDIGNTNIVIGCCEDNKILFRDRISTNHTATVLEYIAILKTAFELNEIAPDDIGGIIISSVVPAVTDTLKKAAEKYTNSKAIVVGPGIKTGLSILIDNPAQLGSDLVVDAVAGINNYPLPLIVIDMGTATTLSVIGKQGDYLGGMIVPGVCASRDSLIRKTSQLPKIAFERPKRVIGRNTVECMKSGLLYSSAGAIDGLIDRISDELGDKCTVVATGGLANVIIPLCKSEIIIDDDLLLKGLMIIYNKNN